MHEILENLAPGQRVLDLGSGSGSFASSVGPFIAIRADLDQPSRPAPNLARADAARLPFPDRAFDAVISNHSLEHFHDLAGSLAEIGRVLKPTGALYIAVPDASTFSDRLYRLLARGGGHVNPFTFVSELARDIERATHLRHVDTRTLCTSFCYLNRSNPRTAADTGRFCWWRAGAPKFRCICSLISRAFRIGSFAPGSASTAGRSTLETSPFQWTPMFGPMCASAAAPARNREWLR